MNQLQKNDFEFIQKFGQKINFQEGQFLFHEGDACAHFVLVDHGKIKVQKVSENGRQVVLYKVYPNNICILTTSCLLGKQSYNAEGVAEESGEAFLLPQKPFRELMSTSESFRDFVFSSLSGRISDLILKIDDIAFTKIGTRLARLLLEHCRENNEVQLGHQDLADEIGTAREVISRHLKEFENQGLIKVQRKLIEIVNKPALEKMV